VATVQAQKVQGEAQEEHQAQLTAANNAATAMQLSSLRIQQSQAKESSARETQKAKQATDRAKATAVVAAGEAGVQGNSVDALLSEYSSNLGQYKEAVTRQAQINDASFEDQASAAVKSGQYQNLNINAPIERPQYGTAALNFGTSAMGAVTAYRANQAAAKKNGSGKG
jgi:hypothetical protein